MKYYGQGTKVLGNKQMSQLDNYREKRGFDVEKYLQEKQETIISYLREYSISDVVVALSGGIDSSVVYAMLQYMKEQDRTNTLKEVHGICLPALTLEKGVTNQNKLNKKVIELVTKYNAEYKEYDMTPLVNLLDKQYEEKFKEEWLDDGWAKGQVVSYLRTPVYYYYTSLLSANGKRSVVVGTTNKDEGAYLGYFGKASDGMVDIQLISDLHKREVYLVGEFLGVPETIMKAVPTGDMYDSRSDEEVFGTSYDFVELYLHYLEEIKNNEEKEKEFKKELGKELEIFNLNAESIEQMHKYNKHKYLGYSPAVHMDIILGTEKIENGWHYYNYKAPKKGFVNEQDFTEETKSIISKTKPVTIDFSMYDISNKNEKAETVLYSLNNFIPEKMLNAIKDEINTMNWVAVGENGMLKDYKEGDKIGSKRLSIYSEELSEYMTNYLKDIYPKTVEYNDYSQTEIDNHYSWKFEGVNPLMRFIKYENDGKLIPHYDWSYVQDDENRTLVTLLIYLESDCKGGYTRFIKDEQKHLKLVDRDLKDWENFIPDVSELIDYEYIGQDGSAILFEHGVLHDSSELKEGTKIVLRTDLMFSKVH